MQSDITPPDISEIMDEVEALLDRSIASKGYIIHDAPADSYGNKRLVDLSTVDFEALKKHFENGRKRTETEKLKNALAKKLENMIYLNKNRIDFMDKFQQMIDEYNAGSLNIETFFDKLIQFAKDLNEEEKRAIAEGLSEEELTIFDLLTKPEMKISKKEEQLVKKVAQDLLLTLKREKLVIDWRKKQQARAAVRLSIEEILDQLPRVYTPSIYKQKCDAVYQHVYEAYFGSNKSIYSMVG
jgi:type I restriction enzyme R subunit